MTKARLGFLLIPDIVMPEQFSAKPMELRFAEAPSPLLDFHQRLADQGKLRDERPAPEDRSVGQEEGGDLLLGGECDAGLYQFLSQPVLAAVQVKPGRKV